MADHDRKLNSNGFRITRQCAECPWRRDVPTGKFPPERYVRLFKTVQQGLNPHFACHRSADETPQVCVGYLLVDGVNNWSARYAAAMGAFDPKQLVATGPLYESFVEMALANGVDIDDLVVQGEYDHNLESLLGEMRRLRGEEVNSGKANQDGSGEGHHGPARTLRSGSCSVPGRGSHGRPPVQVPGANEQRDLDLHHPGEGRDSGSSDGQARKGTPDRGRSQEASRGRPQAQAVSASRSRADHGSGARLVKRARRLATIAKWINENVAELEAQIVSGYCNTDRKIGRLRHPGKGRTGNRLIVKLRKTGETVLDHNAAQTYRSNGEVEDWLKGWLERRPKRRR